MVQTRSASGIDVPPPPTPSRARSVGAAPSTRKRKSTPAVEVAPVAPVAPVATTTVTTSTVTKSKAKSTASTSSSYIHTPSSLTLGWLAFSLPLVAWDTAYVLLRPHTMPGGDWHWPLFQPYALYGEVDHVYGRKQWDAGNGFTGAQGSLNLVETLLYVAYLWEVRRLPKSKSPAQASQASARAVLLLFTAVIMTLSKTVLYWLNEAFSGFDNIRQNDTMSLVTMWIIPNGLWIVFPAIIAWTSGHEIVRTLAGTSKTSKK